MTLYVRLEIGGRGIGTAVIENDGQVDADADLWRYTYDVIAIGAHIDACPHGDVVHHRPDGAWALVAAVLDDCRDRLPRA